FSFARPGVPRSPMPPSGFVHRIVGVTHTEPASSLSSGELKPGLSCHEAADVAVVYAHVSRLVAPERTETERAPLFASVTLKLAIGGGSPPLTFGSSERANSEKLPAVTGRQVWLATVLMPVPSFAKVSPLRSNDALASSSMYSPVVSLADGDAMNSEITTCPSVGFTIGRGWPESA